jgi:putative transposase
MNEYEKRKEAILRYNGGEKITSIVRSFQKTRQWFYNWLARYKNRDADDTWYLDHSTAPLVKPTKINDLIEYQVLQARQELEDQHFAQTGAIAIQYELYRCGLQPPPVWTINRIIARNGLNQRPPKRKQSKEYPELFVHSHQMDLVGPRYLKGDGRFYSLNFIDALSHSCYIKPVRVKSSAEILPAIVEFWSSHGMPDALQMDNELAFRGSNRHPRSFGSVVRFALSQGVAPVFIPLKEPWRNGLIEKFNNTYDKRFFRCQNFINFTQISSESPKFVSFHNANHRYSSQEHKTPDEIDKMMPTPVLYKGDIHLQKKIPLETGCVYYIRFIRSDLNLHLPTESFKVKEELKYSYVVAEVNIDNQCLAIRQNNEIVQLFDYRTPVDW